MDVRERLVAPRGATARAAAAAAQCTQPTRDLRNLIRHLVQAILSEGCKARVRQRVNHRLAETLIDSKLCKVDPEEREEEAKELETVRRLVAARCAPCAAVIAPQHSGDAVVATASRQRQRERTYNMGIRGSESD